MLAGLALTACGSSGLDSDVSAQAESVAAVAAPVGFSSTTSPTNGSVIKEYSGVPIDYTGALTMKNHARVLYSSAEGESDAAALCASAGVYFGQVVAATGVPVDPAFSEAECVALLPAALAGAGESVVPVWSGSAMREDLNFVLGVYAAPGDRVLTEVIVEKPHD